jgi:hypothetical protein
MGHSMTDEIVEELWQVKDNLAKEFNYNLDALAAELQRRQKESGREVVNLARAPSPQPDNYPQATNH